MPHSGKIEETSNQLHELGWVLDFFNFKIQQFTMHVDYDKKQLAINCPKAYHTSQMLDHVLGIASVEAESLSEQKCRVSGSYVYYFVGLEVFIYDQPTNPDRQSFANLMLTGMPRSMYTGEFMPEDKKVELTEVSENTDRAVMHIEVEGDVSVQTTGHIVEAVQNAKSEV